MTKQARDATGFPYPAFRMGTVQKVSYTGTAGTISNGVGNYTKLAIVQTTSDAHFVVGTAPTATTNDRPIKSGVDVLVRVEAGGTLYVTELV